MNRRSHWCSKSHERCRDNNKHCSVTGAFCTGDLDDNDCPLVGETCEKDCQLKFCSVSATICEQDGDCPDGQTCGDEVCIASNSCLNTGQTCVQQNCESSCGAGSALLAPVFLGQQLLIRVGGEYGGEPNGDLTLECLPADCNDNGIPDPFDIEGGLSTDCNGNLLPDDCDIDDGLSIDCDFDGLPDECQIESESPVTCRRCSIPGADCYNDVNCGPEGGLCSVTAPSTECYAGPFYCLFDCDPDADHNGIPDACICAAAVSYASSVPDASDVGEDAIRPEGTLWRTANNVIRITLDGAADAAPNAGDVEIRELWDDGAFGPDLSASFEFSMEDGNTVLRIKDTGSTIEHQKWYAITNVGGWLGVCAFERHYASAYGDGSGDGLVQFADLAFINGMINQPPVSPDADRHDINGDNLIQFADLAAANATINLHAIPKPTGHWAA